MSLDKIVRFSKLGSLFRQTTNYITHALENKKVMNIVRKNENYTFGLFWIFKIEFRETAYNLIYLDFFFVKPTI